MGKRIFQYPEVTELAEDDYIMIDSETDDTRCILASKIAPSLMSKTVTERKVYTASEDGVKGYSSVDVKVPFTNITDLEGDVVTFDDGEDFPLASLKTTIVPIQDLHGYDSPWVGGSGRNLFSVGSRVDGTIADVRYTSDDEYIYLNGTKQGVGYADLSSASNITLDSGTYYIRAFVISGTASNTVELYPYDGTNNLTSNIINNERTLTLSESKTFRFRFAIWSDGTVLTNYKVGIVVSKTSSIDKFYPYSNICPISGWDEANIVVSPTTDAEDGHTYTIPFLDSQGNPVTVYGGECDVVNGGEQPSPLKKIVFDGSNDEDWRHYGGNRVTVAIDDFTSPANGVIANIKCDKLKTITKSQQGGVEYVISGSDEGYHQFMVNVGISNIAELRTWLSNNPITVVYELSTPSTFTTQSTSIKSIEGVNNVWADCGKSLVSYQKTWIQPDFTPDNN